MMLNNLTKEFYLKKQYAERKNKAVGWHFSLQQTVIMTSIFLNTWKKSSMDNFWNNAIYV